MNIRRKNTRGRCLISAAIMVALAMIVFVPTMARAEILAASVDVNPVVYGDGVSHLLPINGASAVLSFATTVPNQRVAVLFNAECAVKSADTLTFVDVDVMIDGVVVPPSNSDNAFCTSMGGNVLTRWISASTNVIRIVPNPGIHRVQVRATLRNFNVGEQFRIDDISVIVLR